MLPAHSCLMPSALPEIRLRAERGADLPAREALLDAAMGKARKRKSSEAIRRGRLAADGLSLIAEDEHGHIAGTVRLWHVDAGGVAALLLGPLAVQPGLDGMGIGSMLMRRAIAEASFRGHRAILLVGDAPYYERFGFSARHTAALAMPGPYERHRLLALELVPGALSDAAGVIRGTGRRGIAERKAA